MAVVNLFGVKDTGTSVAILHCLLATVFCSVPVPSCDLNIASFACVQSHTYHLLCPQASALELAAAGAPIYAHAWATVVSKSTQLNAS